MQHLPAPNLVQCRSCPCPHPCPALPLPPPPPRSILLSTATQLGEHLDRGLFNLVLGSPADLASIWLNLPSGAGVMAGAQQRRLPRCAVPAQALL